MLTVAAGNARQREGPGLMDVEDRANVEDGRSACGAHRNAARQKSIS